MYDGGSASTTRIAITVERLLVRTWNLFHGNTKPPGRRAFLERMVALAIADAPDVVCLQEVPVWALSRLRGWSGMQSVGAVAKRPKLPPELGRRITSLHNGLLRSFLTGQANAVLLAGDLRVLESRLVVLNRGLRWRRERRVCQVVRLERFVLANLHATHYPRDLRIAESEVSRAARFVTELAGTDAIVLAGDFNLTAEKLDLEGFSGATPIGVDHVLVRGVQASAPQRWPRERRTWNGHVLSDHTPVDVRVE